MRHLTSKVHSGYKLPMASDEFTPVEPHGGHGTPLRDVARERLRETIARVYGQ